MASAFDLATDRIGALPGVRAVAFSEYALIEGDRAMPYLHVPGQPKQSDEDRTVYTQAVSATFFSTMEMPIIAGRAFAAADRTAPVAIVNETLARRFFPGTLALGHQIAITKDPTAVSIGNSQLLEIVGIVRDAKYMTIRETTLPTAFYPNADSGRAVFAVRAGGDPTSLIPTIQQTLRELRPALVPSEFRTQADQTARTFAEEQHFAWISSLFGSLALLLTSIGLYGLLSYRVARRTRDIGIRVALGASRACVVRSVLGEMLVLVAAGVVAGLGAAALITRLVQSTLFGLAPWDPISQAVAVAMMLAVAIVAALVPARRATRLDPVSALRAE
jgi:predicted permease